MTITDPISDMINRISNASKTKKEKVDIPASKLKAEIARVLKNEGYIANCKVIEDRKQGILRVYLKYTPDKKSVITGIKKVSRSGRRAYKGTKDLPRILAGLGTAVVSTNKGLMTDKEARLAKIGGEVICYVW
ncbi:MAG: 30S ribosomal protein S8 [bacterium]|nr:30S ribosomal protein S8 [bacterium]